MDDAKVRYAHPLLKWGPLAGSLLLIAVVGLTGSNVRLFLWFNELHHLTGDALWANLTVFGDGLVAPLLVLPLVRRRPDIVWASVLALCMCTLWVVGLQAVLNVPRPLSVLDPDALNVIGPAHRYGAFPSGHAATIFALAGVWILFARRTWLRLAIAVFAVVVSLSRIVVGVHWPTDVLGGAFGGWLSSWLGVVCAQRFPWGVRPVGRRVVGGLLLLAALTLLLFNPTGYDQARGLELAVAVVALGWGGIALLRMMGEPLTSA